MTTDLRHLLAIYVHAHQTGNSVPPHIDAEARAALADEPAVPEGREPAAVTGRPSDAKGPEDADLHAMAFSYSQPCYQFEYIPYARAVLARWGNPAPTPPADGEVAELVKLLQYEARQERPADSPSWCAAMERAAELLQRQALVLVPVAVAERPWEREGWCDKNGNCWLGGTALGDSTPTWIYGPAAWAERFPALYRTLLPTHTLPLPEVDK